MKKRYKDSYNRIAIVENSMGAGLCQRTLGLTFVLFNFEDQPLDYPLIMHNEEFYRKYTLIE